MGALYLRLHRDGDCVRLHRAHGQSRPGASRYCPRTLIKPTAAPAATNQAEFTLYRINATPAAIARTTVTTSNTAARANCHVTTTIKASEAAFTPSRNAPAVGDFRMRGINGPLIATKKNAGRK